MVLPLLRNLLKKKPDTEKCWCGDGCYRSFDQNMPCWGKVEAIDLYDTLIDGDKTEVVIHACEGHKAVYNGDPYHPPFTPSKMNVDDEYEWFV